MPWTALTPSAQAFVDPDSGARGVIRDTGASGAKRSHWHVTPLGQYHPLAEGRAGELVRARSIAEFILRTYAEDCLAISSTPAFAKRDR
jgi:hypothetical protein